MLYQSVDVIIRKSETFLTEAKNKEKENAKFKNYSDEKPGDESG